MVLKYEHNIYSTVYTLNVYQTVDVGVGWEGEGGSVSKDAKWYTVIFLSQITVMFDLNRRRFLKNTLSQKLPEYPHKNPLQTSQVRFLRKVYQGYMQNNLGPSTCIPWQVFFLMFLDIFYGDSVNLKLGENCEGPFLGSNIFLFCNSIILYAHFR